MTHEIRRALFDAASLAESGLCSIPLAFWYATDAASEPGVVSYGARMAAHEAADGRSIWAMGAEEFAATARLAAVTL